jgi:hypothetical protein
MLATGTGNRGSVPEREPERRLPLPRKAAGAQITQFRLGEVETGRNDAGPTGICNWNEQCVKGVASSNSRTSLVPAPAVIPARGNFINAVAVETLVVGPCALRLVRRKARLDGARVSQRAGRPLLACYCEEIRVFKAGDCLDTLAWDNRRASCRLLVGESL